MTTWTATSVKVVPNTLVTALNKPREHSISIVKFHPRNLNKRNDDDDDDIGVDDDTDVDDDADTDEDNDDDSADGDMPRCFLLLMYCANQMKLTYSNVGTDAVRVM